MLSTNIVVPCLPNFFIKGKGPNSSTPIYKNQALYNSTLGT